METIFALVDCNSFYCSCERLFRPDLRDRPVGVLSNNDGCFVSRTNELKALGVPMGAPYFKYRRVCETNNVAVFSANFALYTNLSDRVMSVLAHYTPKLEVYSVDEAFLDLSGFDNYNLEVYCEEIRRKVYQLTGIPVSIGIARTKTLAKVANRIAKKGQQLQGVFSVLNEKNRQWALERTPVEDIWGIGRKKAIKLRALGIKTASQFRDYRNERTILKVFTKLGRQTQDELREISCFELTTQIAKKKEILSSRTFGSPVFDLKTLRESVANYASLACEKLRKQNSVCATVEVWIRTNPHKEIPQYYALDAHRFQSHTGDTRKVIKYAWKVLDELYQQGYEYKKAMIKLSGIQDREQSQVSLFEKPDSSQSEKLMQVIDQINQREGPHTIRSMACGVDNSSWKMRQDLKSKRFVTGWSELPKVK